MNFKKLPKGLRDLEIGLTRLKFTENFQAFKKTLTISAGSTLTFENELSPRPITEWTVLRVKALAAGTVNIVEPLSPSWTKDALTLANRGTADAEVTIVFFA